MWFNTGDGLNKYDGYSFTVYYRAADDTNSPGSDGLTCVFEDSKGRLWMGTGHKGLDLFDRENNSFKHIRYTGTDGIRSNFILGIREERVVKE